MARVLVRAKIPMWYTQGFNPHAKVIFGLPLSVGTESECEFIDLRIDRDIPSSAVRDQLNRELTDEMRVVDAYEPTSKFQEIGWAKYEIALRFDGASSDVADSIRALFAGQPITMVKKTKSGEKEIDISTMIHKTGVVYNSDRPGEIRMSAVLCAGSAEHLNPELLIKAMKDKLGILSKDLSRESYSILRTHVYLADGVTEFR
jgi:radical SAM-linked protein